MGKDWGSGAVDAGYTDKSSHSTAPGPYGWPPTSQPNVAFMRAFGVPSSSCGLRGTPRMVANMEAAMVHLLPAAATDLAPTSILALACNIFQ